MGSIRLRIDSSWEDIMDFLDFDFNENHFWDRKLLECSEDELEVFIDHVIEKKEDEEIE